MLVLVSGCGGSGSSQQPSALAGRWALEEGNSSLENEFDLLKDGTGADGNYTIAWKAEGGRLYVSWSSGKTDSWEYKISGSTLALMDDGGKKVMYKKKK